MNQEFLDRPLLLWAAALAAFCVIVFGVFAVRMALQRRLDPANHSPWTWQFLVGKLSRKWMRLTTIVVGLAAAILILEPVPALASFARGIIVVALTVQIMLAAGLVVDWGLARIDRSRVGPDASDADRSARSTLSGLRWLALLICYSIILLLALQNLGVDVTAMVAGLGIGGLAVALAAQSILGDLFASLTIALDKPFVVNDFIVVGSEMGSVEHVGLKTTRVRSLSGEQLVFGNSDLLSSRIRNFKRMRERRVLFGFGVVYSTPPDQLEEIPRLVRQCIEEFKLARFDRCHFHRFGESSLDFETVYYVDSPDYNVHMDVQQGILLAIARQFETRQIEFAFPTRTLYTQTLERASEATKQRS